MSGVPTEIFEFFMAAIIILAAVIKALKKGKRTSKKSSSFSSNINISESIKSGVGAAKIVREKKSVSSPAASPARSYTPRYSDDIYDIGLSKEKRLEQIDRYLESGLIDKAEYKMRRDRILSGK